MDFPLQEVLDAITPETRAVLIANPNNPTGTGVGLLGIERILKRARKAVVMIDEAYYEFSGITALPQIEHIPTCSSAARFPRSTAWRRCGWAACFRIRRTSAYLHKAQSPYSVNTLAVAGRAGGGARPRLHRKRTSPKCWRRASCSAWVWRNSASRTCPAPANFVLAHLASAPSRSATACAGRRILVRDRSYEIPGCVRVTVGTREQTRRLLTALEEIW